MRTRHRARLLAFGLAFAALAALAAEPRAAEAAKANGKSAAPDLDFLEYLGTLENDEENWTDIANLELPNAAKDKRAGKSKPKPEAVAKSASSDK